MPDPLSFSRPGRRHCALDSTGFAIDRSGETERVSGNVVAVLEDGDAAYPSMHEAIAKPKHSIRLVRISSSASLDVALRRGTGTPFDAHLRGDVGDTPAARVDSAPEAGEHSRSRSEPHHLSNRSNGVKEDGVREEVHHD